MVDIHPAYRNGRKTETMNSNNNNIISEEKATAPSSKHSWSINGGRSSELWIEDEENEKYFQERFTRNNNIPWWREKDEDYENEKYFQKLFTRDNNIPWWEKNVPPSGDVHLKQDDSVSCVTNLKEDFDESV